ncbi:asparagine synthase (glutamine-hydrolyzing) [Denitratisoma oestradiolicum]|uniref:asparagine synthase (glutamine-hydrolyzing) n=1 Tax=Denitratisoma oestradiolicum TaxID=311182 RepID=A0A6S6XWI6_9PROT|nr:asparagine synthase (glutamine-hydrolyzing) [Denitratisoma oestradiolicum]TWO79304.1 asparagine synthase (glutamine-hydrolyzing) [Denitratisoma oestradiolicum]CAB1370369.1 Asparagine synthase (Glutamine-hydrolyzing) [Denitratisoma oestradiolicum]
MCGILGFIGTRWRAHAALGLSAIKSRGPDEQTVLDLGEAVLAHTRLAVIDLAGGHQPMTSADGRHTIVFNGEIYNFAELRNALEGKGHVFATRSDTEVLLQGYREWGEGLLPRLDGMFAFALWDRMERRLFAARDALGIKPLMYGAVDGGLVFASTLAPFLALPDFPRRLDPEALRDYLAFQVALAPHTFLAAVQQLPPAHCLRFDAASGRLETSRWWSIPRARPCTDDRETLVVRTDTAIRESVKRQLVADVPLGAFLSGGIDSSLMVRYMAEAGGAPLKTFSLRFADAGFDESAHAQAVAAAFGCEHHVLDAPAIDADTFAATIHDLDQPLADPAYVMTHALARLTREHVTVAISGDGGDEVFGGYPRFLDTEDRHPQRPGQALLRRLVEAGLLPAGLLRRGLWGQDLLLYRRGELGPWPVGRKNLAAYLAPDIRATARPENTLGLWRDQIAELGGKMDAATLMRADLWTYLSENCLAKTDRASMAHGLEVRVPLLGQPVLEATLGLPAEAHFAGGTKALLTELARRHLPETVWNRPKHGFSVPLDKLFNGPWRGRCEDALTRIEQLAPFLDAGAARRAWRDGLSRRGSRRLAYTLVVLLLWLERHGLSA